MLGLSAQFIYPRVLKTVEVFSKSRLGALFSHRHDHAWPRFHHRDDEIQEGSRAARLKQEGSSRGRATEARILRRDLRCTRVMICSHPDRDPVRLAGWPAGR